MEVNKILKFLNIMGQIAEIDHFLAHSKTFEDINQIPVNLRTSRVFAMLLCLRDSKSFAQFQKSGEEGLNKLRPGGKK